jgi:purine-binding chemotaxis protein CheW
LAVPAAPSLADQTYGLMRIGGALLALPVSAIREVVAGQAAYTPLPVKAEGLLGAVDIRGAIIPVLDLRSTLGLATAPDGVHLIVIMRHEGRLIGLTVDEVCGIARPQPANLFRLSTAAPRLSSALATHTFQTQGEIATVLDAKGIAELSDVPLVEEKAPPRRDPASAATESILLFRYGRSYLGINATCVDATVPAVAIRKTALSVGHCLGVIDHHGYEVPVVDTQAAIGLGMGEPQALTPVIVIRLDNEALLGFAIDEVRDIIRVATADIVAMPLIARGDAALFRGMIASEAEQRDSLVLNAAALRADPNLTVIAELRKPSLTLGDASAPGASPRSSADWAGRPQTYLTYAAGAELATPLEQIKEIVNYPTDISPFDFPTPGLLGLFKHRNQVTPLVSLAALLGKRYNLDPAQARVLFVEHGGMTAGFAVESLRSIDTASWRSSDVDAPTAPNALFKSLVMVGAGDGRRMVSQVDLIEEITAFYGPAADRPPLPAPLQDVSAAVA